MKICSKCNIEKPFSEFRTRKLVNDKIGYRGECIECGKKVMKLNYQIRQETLRKIGPQTLLEKHCPICDETKTIDKFHKNKARKDGLSVYCSNCTNQYNKRPERLEYDKKRCEIRREKESYLEYQKDYRKKNMKKFIRRNFEIYHSNPLEKLKKNFRNRIMKYIDRKSVPSESIIGCSWETFKQHIENQFQKGMTWDNHSQFGWHLDHIIPISTAKTEQDLYRLNHYTNFQPLWWRDNIIKSDKIIEYKTSDN
jgi:uncharacterized Zn finger protein (UPF0148 family)